MRNLKRCMRHSSSLADKKKEVYDEDIEALITDKVKHIAEVYVLKNLRAESGTGMTPSATVEMQIDGQDGQADRKRRRTG